jgi:hypothetical protein
LPNAAVNAERPVALLQIFDFDRHTSDTVDKDRHPY